ncbi:MAG: ATP synthase F1 subunit epsilon [Verrucomicrobiaceae bacterium]|jgi:F-type H+-transporting ATPase subunit epsilon|nr:ATP synthase F1 subunit epsilon [Verrucomicrobiaceae bacterium]
MSLTLEIITPEGIVWHGENLTMITLPTTSGEVGIMSGHIPLITLLNEGAVFVTRENSSTESIAIDRGYARCMGDVVSVLTEAAIDVSKLSDADIEQAKQMAKEAAEKVRNSSLDADELEKLEAQIRFTLAKELAKAKKRG